MMPVIDLAVQFKQPAHYDDLLEITTRFDEVPRVRVRIDYDVRRTSDPALLVTGHVTLCFFDPARQRPVGAPPAVRALFEQALGPLKPLLPL